MFEGFVMKTKNFVSQKFAEPNKFIERVKEICGKEIGRQY